MCNQSMTQGISFKDETIFKSIRDLQLLTVVVY